MKKFKPTMSLKALFLWAVFSSLLLGNAVFAQTVARKISGKISSATGKTLAAASVINKRTNVGTNTDNLGAFTIQAKTGDVLVVTYVGYQEKQIRVGSANVLNVTITEELSKMDEVVVIGYGRARKVNLTSAQTSVTSKDMEKTVNTTIEQAIQGRAAGVYVTQNSGQPGGGISVSIRGISTFNGSTEPLYVIDGVQLSGGQISYGSTSSSNPLAGLNPADIEDIQILQGPSATAVFGSRGANGVLMVTTKRGKSGLAKIIYGLQYSIQTPPKHLEVMNLPQYAQMVKDYNVVNYGTTPVEFLDPSLLGNGTDWQHELFKKTPMIKHQLSMSGGTDKSTYYLSGEYLDQKGVAVGSGFKRYGFRLNMDNKPREWLTVGTNLSFNQTDENLTSSQENIISDALQLTPQTPIKNLDGTWGGGNITRDGASAFAPVNPIAIANLKINTLLRRQFSGGINLGINLTKDLTFRNSFNTSISSSSSVYYQPTYSIGWAINPTAKLENGTSQNVYWNWNQMLEYNKQLGKHNIALMASHEAQGGDWKNVSASRTGFLTNDILDLNAGDATTASNGGGASNFAMESYLGRISYNYDNRYILMATDRWDGSKNFGPKNRWGSFPSLSAAWRISQEKFFKVPFISDLKLRYETGTVGNQGWGGFYSPLTTGPTPTGTGFLPSSYSNDKIKWESTYTNNIGLNASFLKNRISIEMDYYVKKTDNLIMTALLPWYMGSNGQAAVGAPVVNLGSMQNKGWGITLNTTNIVNKDFKWESNFNISAFKAKILKFNSDNGFLDKTSWWMDSWTQRAQIGEAPWLFRGYVYDGLFQSVKEINESAVPVDNQGARLATAEGKVWVGDVKFKDISGPDGKPDGIIDSRDQTNIGNPWPKMFGGFTNTFSYKGFDLSILITATYGNDIYNYLGKLNSDPVKINIGRNLLVGAMDYAVPIYGKDSVVMLANPNATIPRIKYNENANNRTTSKWVEDGSFIRLKNISLSYSIPESLLKRQHLIKGLRLTFGAQNLLTLTHYTGFDPEVGAYVGRDASAGNQAIGLDNGRYPLTPVYTFNLNANF